MTKQFIAYFKTEDDLLSARASLNTVRTHDITIDQVQRDNHGYTFIPYVSINYTTSNTGFTAFYQDEQDERGQLFVLEGEADDRDYDDVIKILKQNGGYEKGDHII
ncbi:hypothetical protein [Oceanobacillus salinisoli]|uniref:hypothetical protein n=1 Tax=Oceanobacillus salinisoli TaxID=2678611 RepID=UPI0012E17308|nr:hypothetical protein [Oceanobacillus salinisoli]